MWLPSYISILSTQFDILYSGLEILFFGGSKLLLPSWRPGSKTNFVVAKLYVQFYAAVVLGCVDDRITNITQKCIKLTIPWIYGRSKCLLPHQNPGSKWENMVAFATKIPQISSPVYYTISVMSLFSRLSFTGKKNHSAQQLQSFPWMRRVVKHNHIYHN